MKIFLDDIRNPKDCLGYMYHRIGAENFIYLEDWLIVKNYDEFCKVVREHFSNISHISFDHDLADEHYNDKMWLSNDEDYNALYDTFKERTGYDAAIWLKDFWKDIQVELPKIIVHSMNPIGRKNIENIFK